MQYLYTARFLRTTKKCEEGLLDDVIQAIKLFEKRDEGDKKVLKLHKLHGKFKMYHAFSANYSYRIIIKMVKNVTYYVDIGTHDIYR